MGKMSLDQAVACLLAVQGLFRVLKSYQAIVHFTKLNTRARNTSNFPFPFFLQLTRGVKINKAEFFLRSLLMNWFSLQLGWSYFSLSPPLCYKYNGSFIALFSYEVSCPPASPKWLITDFFNIHFHNINYIELVPC